MSSVLLLLLICAGALLSSAGAQDAYDLLPDHYKKGVDLALDHLSFFSGVHHHFRFFRSVDKSDVQSGFNQAYVYHHFYLKPTRCAKGTPVSNLHRCSFRNDRPQMDCAVCFRTDADEIAPNPKPYVHCIQKPRLTQEMRVVRWEHCSKHNYNSGSATLLAVVAG